MTDEQIRLIVKNAGSTFTIFPRASVWDPAFVFPVIEHNQDGTFTLHSDIDAIVAVLAETSAGLCRSSYHAIQQRLAAAEQRLNADLSGHM